MAKAKKKAAPPPPRIAQFLTAHARWIVVGLLALFVFMAWSAVREKSTTFDEMAHLTGGTSYWQKGDYRLHPENGVLPQRLEALPLVLMGVKFPDTNQAAWWTSNVWRVGFQFFYDVGNNVERMLWWARGTVVVLGVVLGWVVYTWSRRLFGVVGGLVSLAAFVFCPNILAHSALATSDLTAALLFVASLGAFWVVLHRVGLATVALSAVVMGLLFVAKMSAVLILPAAVALLAIRLAWRRPLVVKWRSATHLVRGRWRQLGIFTGVLAIHALVAWMTIWLFFGFRYATSPAAEAGRDKMYFEGSIESMAEAGTLGKLVQFAHDRHLLPQPYLYGFAVTVELSKARTAFLNGERSQVGWRMFFPYAFLWKTPLPTMGLLMAAVWAAVANWTAVRGSPNSFLPKIRRRVVRGLYRTAPLWVFLIIYWGVAIRTNLNIGHRHILPTYPLMFILIGAAGYWLMGQSKWPRAMVSALVVLLAVESATMYPHYLAYFNQLAGGPRHGYRRLVDSSLDWGQDLPGLKRWLSRGQDPAWHDRPVYLSYFGTGNPHYYRLNTKFLPGYIDWGRNEFFMLEPGTYCISASMLPCIFILPHKPWNDEYEEMYQQYRKTVVDMVEQQREPGFYERMAADPNRRDEARKWSETLTYFDQLRFARLCRYLWEREPDDSIGYSILIYHLDADDLDAALNQPWKKPE